MVSMPSAASDVPVTDSSTIRIVPLPPEAGSPHEDLRKRLFADSVTQASCASITTGPKGNLMKVESDLDRFIANLLDSLQKRDVTNLLRFFHPRLGVRPIVIEAQLHGIERIYGKPIDWSIRDLWALNSVDGSTKGLACGPGLNVYPLYGYPLQFGLWLQAMGPKELGRIYMGIVPANGRWNIGSFHVQQWTHSGREASSWAEEAARDVVAKEPMAAWAKFDLARKLASGGGFVELAATSEALALRDQQMTEDQWKNEITTAIAASAKDREIAHVSTMLADGGVGILIRFRTNRDLALSEIKSSCAAIGKDLAARSWSNRLAGLRCSWILPKEGADKDGVLGGIYYSFASLRSS